MMAEAGNAGNHEGQGTGAVAARLLLIDGYSLIFRAFFALPPDLRAADGQQTQAVLGFMNMLVRLLAEQNPTHVAVAFDAAGPTFRHEAFADYKAHREKTPAELRSQLPLVQEILAALNIPVVEQAGYEADDVIGTLATLAHRWGEVEVSIVSGDRDLLQIVGNGVKALLTRRGISDLHVYDLARVRADYGVEPAQLVEVKGLMGDTSDNIPGVPGVGEKTALKLIHQFGDIETVLANLDAVGGKKLPATLAAHADMARTSRALAAIARDVDLPFADLTPFLRQPPNEKEAVAVLERLGFRALIDRLGLDRQDLASAAGRAQLQTARYPVHIRAAGDSLADLYEQLAGAATAAIIYRHHAPEPDPRHDPLAVLVINLGSRGTWALFTSPEAGPATGAEVGTDTATGAEAGTDTATGAEVGTDTEVLAILEPLFRRVQKGTLELVVHDLKPLLARWGAQQPLPAPAPSAAVFDTAVAAYLLDPSRTTYRLDEVIRQYLTVTLTDPGSLVPARRRKAGQRQAGFWDVEPAALTGALAAMAELLPDLRRALVEGLEQRDMVNLFTNIETPLIFVLAAMERWGVRVDPAVLSALGETIAARISALSAQIYGLAGTAFNLNSPQQLGKVLFEDLGLPVIKRTKTGYSTDAGVLEALAGSHGIIELVTEHRQLAKLQGTYVQGLANEIDPVDGRIHTTFQQMVASTGRLASTAPNLQNIPIRDEPGRGLRRAFTADDGCLLVTADYSQIELRVLAHLSGDPGLVAAFAAREDVHRRTAAEVFAVPLDAVTPAQRSAAKAVNFGIIYGISDFGLARQLRIDREEAKQYIAAYFDRYPRVQSFIREQVDQARINGYVQTLFNRIRYLPDIDHRVAHRRQAAERTAMNTPIQGAAADLIKSAMVRVESRLRAEGLAARLVLQIHDELMVEAPAAEVDAAVRVLVEEMTGCIELAVPLLVDVNVGANWYDIAPYKGEG